MPCYIFMEKSGSLWRIQCSFVQLFRNGKHRVPDANAQALSEFLADRLKVSNGSTMEFSRPFLTLPDTLRTPNEYLNIILRRFAVCWYNKVILALMAVIRNEYFFGRSLSP